MINEHEIFNEKRLYNIIKLGLAATGTTRQRIIIGLDFTNRENAF